MIFLIGAQVARAAVIWTTNYTAKKVLRTAAVVCVGIYLTKRHKKSLEREAKREF